MNLIIIYFIFLNITIFAVILKIQSGLRRKREELDEALIKKGIIKYIAANYELRVKIFFKPDAIVNSDDDDEIANLKREYIAEFNKMQERMKIVLYIIIVAIASIPVVGAIIDAINPKK